jgi:glycine/D-amino acid oxidase-like deaminating enzyme
MTLHYGTLYWPETDSAEPTYPILQGSKKTKVAIVGGGMSGVVCGYLLAKSGIPATIVEQRRIASGSTSANTGLLQYSNDKMLSELAQDIGESDAARFYRACKQASEHLSDIAEGLPRNTGFKRRSSLYYASKPDDAPKLRQEYEMLHRLGFPVEWWDEGRIGSSFPFRKSAAIVTRGDAEVNPYQFVQAMAEEAARSGLDIYERTAMTKVEPVPGGYRLTTPDGVLETEYVVYAVGYIPETAGGRWIRARLSRSFVLVTDPMASLADWHERFMLWETARPYLYFRTTEDGRIIAGGLDENDRQPVLTPSDLKARTLRLLSEIRTLFPGLDPRIRYEWSATFGESLDGLPWIGEDPDRPGQFYCLGYGGNGTIYSMLGAEIIRDRLNGERHPIADLVKPDRNPN